MSDLDDVRLLLVGRLAPTAYSRGLGHGLYEVSTDEVIGVPNGLRPLLAWLSTPRTIGEARAWLRADGAPDDGVLRDLAARGRLRAVPPGAGAEMIAGLHGLTVRLDDPISDLASGALGRLADESLGREDVPTSVHRIGLDADEVWAGLLEALAADVVRLEVVRRRRRRLRRRTR